MPIVNPYGGAADWYDPAKPLLFGYQTLYEEQAAAIGAWAAEDGAQEHRRRPQRPRRVRERRQARRAWRRRPSTRACRSTRGRHEVPDAPTTARSSASVKAKNPDAVVLILAFPEAAAYLKQAKLQGLDVAGLRLRRRRATRA